MGFDWNEERKEVWLYLYGDLLEYSICRPSPAIPWYDAWYLYFLIKSPFIWMMGYVKFIIYNSNICCAVQVPQTFLGFFISFISMITIKCGLSSCSIKFPTSNWFKDFHHFWWLCFCTGSLFNSKTKNLTSSTWQFSMLSATDQVQLRTACLGTARSASQWEENMWAASLPLGSPYTSSHFLLFVLLPSQSFSAQNVKQCEHNIFCQVRN